MKRIILLLCLSCISASAGKQISCGDTLPIIYDRGYNISVLGIEHFHPFDTRKYGRVYRRLRQDPGLCSKQFFSAEAASDEQLKRVHSDEYLESLKSSRVIARIAEIPAFAFLPTFILRIGILKPMLRATGGTILGTQLALKHGWAINLSGGYHHAKAEQGEGFCFFADVPIALELLWEQDSALKILIVDLDAHQGNGNSMILGGHPNVAIFDMYNSDIYPNDPVAREKVGYSIPLDSRTNTDSYLEKLYKLLPPAIEKEAPGLIIYNAGTDIYLADPLGRLSITEEGIVERDNFVLNTALMGGIPILTVLSGGYHKRSGEIIARSIQRFLEAREELGDIRASSPEQTE